MSMSSIFDLSIADSVSVKLADRLSLITIVVPQDVAQKHEKLKQAGLNSQNISDLENHVTLLTNYLIQKAFISTIRSLVQSIQISDRLSASGRAQERSALVGIVTSFLSDLYSYELVSYDKEVASTNKEEVISLFENVCSSIFGGDSSVNEEQLPQYLAAKQSDFVKIVLEKGRQQLDSLVTVTASGASNEKIENLLNQMETSNLDWLIDTYSVSLDSTADGSKLPELDNSAQTEIANAVLTKLCDTVTEFDSATTGDSPPDHAKSGNFFSGWAKESSKKSADLTQTNLLQTEQFIMELRLYISYRQQITILTSMVDKVNEFSTSLRAFEAVLAASDRRAVADHKRIEISNRSKGMDNFSNSNDDVKKALAALSGAALRPTTSDADLQEKISLNDQELAEKIGLLNEFFKDRNERANHVLAELIVMANEVKVLSPMVVAEARQKNAQFTTKLLETFNKGVENIRTIEAGPYYAQKLNPKSSR